MYYADKLPREIDIGFTGETDFRKVEIDMSDWLEEMPNGVPGVVYVRPNSTEAYRPEVTMNGNVMIWTIHGSDLALSEGAGRAQLEMTESDNGTVTRKRKSRIVSVHVNKGIMR